MVQYRITAYDKAGNKACEENGYVVTPEFSSIVMLLVAIGSTTAAPVLAKRKLIRREFALA